MSIQPTVYATTKVIAAIPVVGEVVSAKWIVPVAVPAFRLGVQKEKNRQEVEAKVSELGTRLLLAQKEMLWFQLLESVASVSEKNTEKVEEDRQKLITKFEALKCEARQQIELIEEMDAKTYRAAHAIVEKAYKERKQFNVPNLIRNSLSITGGAALIGAGAVASTGPVGVFVAYNAASACYTCGIKSRQDRAIQELDATRLLEPEEKKKMQVLLENTAEEESSLDNRYEQESWEVLGSGLENTSSNTKSIDIVVPEDDYFSTENGKKSASFAD